MKEDEEDDYDEEEEEKDCKVAELPAIGKTDMPMPAGLIGGAASITGQSAGAMAGIPKPKSVFSSGSAALQ